MATSTLAGIIEKSYDLFSGYRATPPLAVCTSCCMKPEDEMLLASLPVSEIPKDLLREYNDSARTEKTETDEVKHFLPRYLDLIAQFDFPTHSTELSFSRIVRFEESEWTAEEWNLLRQFSIEFFRKCLSVYPLPSSDNLDSILIMFWSAGWKIDELLSIWENERTKESTLHFRDFYFTGLDQYHRARLSNPFGEEVLGDILKDWFHSEKVRQNFAENIEQLIIEKGGLEEKDLEELNLLYDIIRPKKNVI